MTRLVPSRRYSEEIPFNFHPEDSKEKIEALKKQIDELSIVGLAIPRSTEGYTRVEEIRTYSMKEVSNIRYSYDILSLLKKLSSIFPKGTLEIWMYIPAEDRFEMLEKYNLE